MRFEQPAAPHVRPVVSVPVIMRRVLYALVPAALCHTWFFGSGLLVNFALTALAALFSRWGEW
jgi:Na+-translocating ferredoxin:NAD+ oxidoreductase RnfD subunit